MLQGPWSFTFRTDEGGNTVEMVMAVDEREPAQQTLQRTARRVGSDTPPAAVVAGNAGVRVAFVKFAEPIAWTVYGWGPIAWLLMGLLIVGGVVGLLRRLLGRRGRGQAT
jgi:uncharacterized membrane protein